MSEFIINNPLYFHLLWIVAAVVAMMLAANVFRRRAMARFATANLHHTLVPQANLRRRWVKTLLLAGALAAMAAALVDVRWGRSWREVPQRGIDVMFVLDVSHSMLAQDVAPNRLERAKQDILDIVHEMQGDRVGLVTFAGDSVQKSPLTTNYREFQLTLEEVGPHSVARGGSDLGRAIEMAARGFLDKSANHKAIVIFSDGEDQDSKPVDAAKSLYQERGIRIFTVGLGDGQQGARIPIRTADGRQHWLQYEGQDVWTKMNGQVLQEVALAGHGAYVPAGTKHVAMDQVYRQHITSIETQQYEQARVNTYIPRYQWFVGLALLLAGSEVLLRDVRKVRAAKSIPAAAVVVGLALIGAAPTVGHAAVAAPSQSAVQEAMPSTGAEPNDEPATAAIAIPEAVFNQAVELYRAGKLDEATAKWSQTTQSGNPGLEAKSLFNLGNCAFSMATNLRDKQPQQAIEQLDTAIAHYRQSVKLNRSDNDARANIELAAKLRQQIRQREEQKQQQPEQDQQQQQEKQQDQPQNQAQSQKNDQPSKQQDKQDQSEQQNQQQQSSDQPSPQDRKSESSQNQQHEQQPPKQQTAAEQDKNQQQEADQQQPDHQQQHEAPQSKQCNPQDQSKKDQQEQPQPQDQQPEKSKPNAADRDPSQHHPQSSQDQKPTQSQHQPSQDKQQELPKPGEKQAEKPEPPIGTKLEANGKQEPADAASLADPSAAELKDGKEMTKAEAAKMLQAIRDRNLQRRIQQLRMEQAQRRPVEKDW
ncbi:MAG: VWA domain-containing protein [Pirellulales bacterium]|nr:VWA domain-containing protein [Pirellulales bacterium]